MKRNRNDHEPIKRLKTVMEDQLFLGYVSFYDHLHRNEDYENVIRDDYNNGNGPKKQFAERVVQDVKQFNDNRLQLITNLKLKMDETNNCALEKILEYIDCSCRIETSNQPVEQNICDICGDHIAYPREIKIYPDPIDHSHGMKKVQTVVCRSDYIRVLLSYRFLVKTRYTMICYINKWYSESEKSPEEIKLFDEKGKVLQKEFVQVLYDRWCDAVKRIVVITNDLGENFFV